MRRQRIKTWKSLAVMDAVATEIEGRIAPGRVTAIVADMIEADFDLGPASAEDQRSLRTVKTFSGADRAKLRFIRDGQFHDMTLALYPVQA